MWFKIPRPDLSHPASSTEPYDEVEIPDELWKRYEAMKLEERNVNRELNEAINRARQEGKVRHGRSR